MLSARILQGLPHEGRLRRVRSLDLPSQPSFWSYVLSGLGSDKNVVAGKENHPSYDRKMHDFWGIWLTFL